MGKFQFVSEFLKAFEANEQLVNRSYVVDSGLSDEAIQALKDRFDLKIEKGIFDFYKEYGALKFHWEIDEDNPNIQFMDKELDIVIGDLHLLPLELTCQPWEQNCDAWPDWKDWITQKAETVIPFLAQLHPVEIFKMEALVGFRQIDGQLINNLFYYDFNEEVLFDLSIDLKTYVSKVVEYKGFWKWQRTIVLPNDLNEALMSHYLPQLF